MSELFIDAGVCYVLFAYDIGFANNLDAAERLITTTTQRETIKHKRRAPQSFQYHPAPVRITQTGEPIAVASSIAGSVQTSAVVDAVLFDFGAVSVAYSVPLRGPLDGLLDLSDALYDNAALLADSRGRVDQILGTIRSAVSKPHASSFVEDYVIYQIEQLRDPTDVDALVAQHHGVLAQVLRSERQPLSRQETDDALACRISYGQNDVTLIDWNAALIIDREAEDIRTVLEFANVELLEVRLLDRQLDDALDRSYESLSQHTRRRSLTMTAHRAAIERVAGWQADSAIVFEGVNNTLKLLGDQFLSRVYRLASQRFHLPDWDAGILRKLSTLESIYGKMSDHQAHRRMELLEWIVIILIALELVIPFLPALRH